MHETETTQKMRRLKYIAFTPLLVHCMAVYLMSVFTTNPSGPCFSSLICTWASCFLLTLSASSLLVPPWDVSPAASPCFRSQLEPEVLRETVLGTPTRSQSPVAPLSFLTLITLVTLHSSERVFDGCSFLLLKFQVDAVHTFLISILAPVPRREPGT